MSEPWRERTRGPRRSRWKRWVGVALAVLGGWPVCAGAAELSESLTILPLATKSSEGDAAKLFEEIDPAESGLAGFTNDYGSPRIWGLQWRTYLFGAIGTGIAAGDIDGDGRPDLVAVSKNERSRIYRNLGGFRFQEITEEAGFDDGPGSGIDKQETPGGGVSLVDVNNDGHLDIYLAFIAAPNQLWINDGSGRFTEQAEAWGIAVSAASVMGYFADYDRDGLLDLYLATNLLQVGDEYPGPQRDRLFRNRGDHFVEVSEEAGIRGTGHAHSAVWWDFDRDGWIDLYVANDFTGVDRLYRNLGDGRFEDVIAGASPRAPYYAMGVDFGDLNGDGLDEFWVADMAPTGRARYKQTLESHSHVYASSAASRPPQYMQNVLLLNLNGKRFADVAALAGLHRTDWTWAVRLSDLDNDGILDAYATNGMLRNFNDGDLGMRLQGRNNIATYARIFKPTPVLKEGNLAWRGRGGVVFEPIAGTWGLDKVGVTFGAAQADFDGDGDLDLAMSNLREPPSIYRNRESRRHRVVVDLRGEASNFYGVGARVELVAGGRSQVKTLMPFRGYMSTDQPILHFGLGEVDRIEQLAIRWPSGQRQAFRDLAVNRRYRIREGGTVSPAPPPDPPRFRKLAAVFPPEVAREDPGFGEFSRQPLLPFARSGLRAAAAATDLNGDGHPDLVLGGPSGQGAVVLLGDGQFGFEHAWSLDLEEDFPSDDTALVTADFDADGYGDLLIASGGAGLDAGDPGYEDRLYTGDGSGGFLRDFETAFSDSREPTAAMALGDFDGDGHRDLFFGAGVVPGRFPQSGRSSLWKGDGNGGFQRVDAQWAPELADSGRVTDAEWIGPEHGGSSGLVILREWGVPEFWRWSDGRFERQPLGRDGPALTGMWTSLAVGDFNGDGRIDLAAGNLGLNAGGLWKPEEENRRLWWRVRDDGIDLIESHLVDGREYPLAWWDRLKEAFPRNAMRARSYTEFATQELGETFGDLAGAGYTLLELEEYRSGVFWQETDGSFRFEPMPRLAQSGRIVDLLAADIDADGIDDLVASVEPVSPAPWIGRREQGQVLLMLGAADRTLDLELAGESGIDVGATSPRSLLWKDFDGDGREELVVVPVEGAPLVFGR